MATILLTGITGNIGRELARLLVNDNIRFRAVARDRQRAQQLLGEALADNIEIAEGDYRDQKSLERAMKGIETVFLVSPDPKLEVNVVEAAKQLKVKRIVKSSAIGFQEEPPAGHKAVEALIFNAGIAFTILRPTAFMQTLATYLPKLVDSNGCFYLPAGAGKTPWIDARDIAAVAAKVLTQQKHDGKIYHLTGPEALTMEAVGHILTTATGVPIRYQASSAEQARQKLIEQGLSPLADFLIQHYQSVQAGGFEAVTNMVATVTGTAPRSFSAFASENKSVWLPFN